MTASRLRLANVSAAARKAFGRLQIQATESGRLFATRDGVWYVAVYVFPRDQVLWVEGRTREESYAMAIAALRVRAEGAS